MKTGVKRHFDHIAKLYDKYKKKNSYYYDSLKQFLRENIPPGSKVLEIGCGTGELLNHVQPAYGYGVDLSDRMIERCREKFPHLHFEAGDSESLSVNQKFEYVMMIDLLDHSPDIWAVLRGVEPAAQEGTILCIATINPLWQPLFDLAEALKLKMPEGPHNFVRLDDIVNLLEVFDYEILKKEMRFFIPKKIPLLSEFINRTIPGIPWLRNLCAVQAVVARKLSSSKEHLYSCSVVIPCHNEEGNIEHCAQTVPQMGKGTEAIFVDDGSTDSTLLKMQAAEKRYPYIKVISYPTNRGKGYAVREGFRQASGEILIILDADLTVPAEDLHQFYCVLSHHKGRFVNGTRLVYPLENKSMRTLNLWGNQFFGGVMSWLLNQRVTDTLCGTKALFKEDYLKMRMGKDQWGDYDLLFGARELNLKIVEVPTHYKRRVAGSSKMKTFRHALLLAKICLGGFLNIKLMRLFSKTHSLMGDH